MAAAAVTHCPHQSLLETSCLVKSPCPPATILSQYCHLSTATPKITQKKSYPHPFLTVKNIPLLANILLHFNPWWPQDFMLPHQKYRTHSTTTTHCIPTEFFFIVISCRVIILFVFFIVIYTLMSISGGFITSLWSGTHFSALSFWYSPSLRPCRKLYFLLDWVNHWLIFSGRRIGRDTNYWGLRHDTTCSYTSSYALGFLENFADNTRSWLCVWEVRASSIVDITSRIGFWKLKIFVAGSDLAFILFLHHIRMSSSMHHISTNLFSVKISGHSLKYVMWNLLNVQRRWQTLNT